MRKMAIIGYGGMANWHYERIAKRIPDLKVTGAYDIRDEALNKIKDLGMHCYKDPEELYADPCIDLVLIATPNDVHKMYSIHCMEAGKNVICEKPAALNATDLEEVIRVSEKTGMLYTVHQSRRWDSDFLTMKRILTEGLLSDPFFIESRVQVPTQITTGWRGYKKNGGGVVLDWAVHLVDQLMFWFPEKVVSVYANLHQINAPEVEDNFTATIRFESGLTTIVNMSKNSYIIQPRWHMCCRDGTAIVENWDYEGNTEGKIVKVKQDICQMEFGEDIVYSESGPTRLKTSWPNYTTQELELPKVIGEWANLYQNILETLNGNAELIVKPNECLRVMKVIDAIFESGKTCASVKCEI